MSAAAAPVTLDMSQSQPLPSSAPTSPVTLDMSQSQPLDGSTQPEPGFLDKTIPLDSHWNATLSGVQSVARGARDAVRGTWDLLTKPPQDAAESGVVSSLPPGQGELALPLYRTLVSLGHTASDARQITAAIHDINQSPDPTGTYAKAAQETAGQGAGQALLAIGTEGAIKSIGATPEAVSKLSIPSKAAAGEILSDVTTKIGAHPVEVSEAADVANEILDKQQTGAKLGGLKKPLLQFLDRATDPDKPLTWAEAREFEQNFRKLTPAQRMNLGAGVRPLLREFTATLRGGIEDAADAAGVGGDFRRGMRGYRAGAMMESMKESAQEHAIKTAVGAAGSAAAAGYGIYKATTK